MQPTAYTVISFQVRVMSLVLNKFHLSTLAVDDLALAFLNEIPHAGANVDRIPIDRPHRIMLTYVPLDECHDALHDHQVLDRTPQPSVNVIAPPLNFLVPNMPSSIPFDTAPARQRTPYEVPTRAPRTLDNVSRNIPYCSFQEYD